MTNEQEQQLVRAVKAMLGTLIVAHENKGFDEEWDQIIQVAAIKMMTALQSLTVEEVTVKELVITARDVQLESLVENGVITEEQRAAMLDIQDRMDRLSKDLKALIPTEDEEDQEDRLDADIWGKFAEL